MLWHETHKIQLSKFIEQILSKFSSVRYDWGVLETYWSRLRQLYKGHDDEVKLSVLFEMKKFFSSIFCSSFKQDIDVVGWWVYGLSCWGDIGNFNWFTFCAWHLLNGETFGQLFEGVKCLCINCFMDIGDQNSSPLTFWSTEELLESLKLSQHNLKKCATIQSQVPHQFKYYFPLQTAWKKCV